ncbi:MAG: YbjN domain-containing protein [Prevotella sp.]|nr:YbjN domain-containing protein [Prevotella sp.]
MTKKEMILEAVESFGYKPHVDDDGDICVRFQMKSICFLIGQEEEQYISAILPQFSEVKEGEETLTLAVCNKVNREVKLAKLYIDQTLKSVTASCDFFYTDMESLKNNTNHVLNILGMVRSAYHRAKAEFAEI